MVDKHDLVHDFPEHRDIIHTLKESNTHFRKQFDEYHEITHEVHKIENNNVNVSDEYFENLKKQRAHLKDALYQTIIKNK